ncbi:phage portal protein [Terrarubrum flagellatum]|uniref:phage portal protein n=1 Tax=Terrirubrum flagellatum TaxID=2895980 RepID=UPI00314547DD
MSGALQTVRSAISRAFGGVPRTQSHMPQIGGSYFRNNVSPFLRDWRPALRETSEDVRQSWNLAAARAVDQIQNSGFIAGMCETSAALVVGDGLKLNAKPDAVALGWTPKQAQDWRTLVESRFSSWAGDALVCDANQRMTFGQMQEANYLAWLGLGEVLAMPLVRWSARTKSVTQILNIPATRLSQQTQPDIRMMQGVFVDGLGAAVGYRIDEITRWQGIVPRDFQRFDADGRRNVIHLFDPGLAVTRGISKFVPALKVTRQLDQFCDATHTAALLQTIFAATVKTNLQGLAAFEGLMTEGDHASLDLAKFLEMKNDWYEAAKIDMSTHGRIAHLMPNEELQFHKAEHPGQQFDMVMQWLLREIALVGGLTYEAATGDYRQATYSSVRMGTSINWNVITKRRKGVPSGYCQGVYETWLEDEIGIGNLPFPGGYEAFLANRQAACRATWSGPPKPQADDLKTAKANQTNLEIGVTTLESVCSENGEDWEDVMEQRARERERAKELGLADPYPDLVALELAKKQQAVKGNEEDKTDDASYTGEDQGA